MVNLIYLYGLHLTLIDMSMLNAIVTNRLIRMKFPGNSYVVGSEEGFKGQE
jgi:hypothetical protein